MRRSRTETAESRKLIVTAAARLIRERGAERVSIADVMKSAGMTHGGFYVHFADKEALLAAATKEAFSEKLDPIDSPEGGTTTDMLRHYVDGYLTIDHVTDLRLGCPIAGLGTDSARSPPEIQEAMADGAKRTVETFARDLPLSEGPARENAIRILASMVGSIVLARALNDPKLQEEVLEVIRQSVPIRSIIDQAATAS